MNLDILLESIIPSTQELSKQIQAGKELAPIGLRRSARLPVLAALYVQLQRPLVLLTDRADHALTLLDELSLWLPDTQRLYFPEPNPLFYENSAWGESIRRDRLAALTLLAAYHIPGALPPKAPPIIVSTVRATMTRTLPRREFLRASRSLKVGQVFHLDELLRSWVSLGYEPVNTVIAPGQFARRGGILDIWPPADLQPARIDFFGDEIDTMRHFDPATQRTIKPFERLLITPAREFLLPQDPDQVAAIANQLSKLTESETAPSEFLIPLFHPAVSGVLDFVPRQAVVLMDDQQAMQDVAMEIEEQAVGLRRDSVADGILPEDFPIPYLTWSEILDALAQFPALELGPTASGEESSELASRFEAGPRFGGRLKTLLDHLAERYRLSEPVVIVSRQASRLHELWEEQMPPAEAQEVEPRFIEGSLAEGWKFQPADGIQRHLLTDGEIFGWRRPEPRYKRSERYAISGEAPESAYSDLQVSDWVVHIDHGIGRFLGLVTRRVDGLEREYLCIEYAENDQLFVPVYQADRLTRYVGPDGHPPMPTRLGSPEWRAVKERASEAVQEVAEDLLELYARRLIVQGTSFTQDTAWQQELEASFPYVETTDQLRVITEVKRDMESPRPMDRLICGDVGYGKTEVALRAAFKAVMAGKQVAVLVPTTVLAQQHFHTFTDRLAAFPVEVEMLSRFRNPHQQRDILNRLGEGGLDIIIGTHRLLQSDVQFKDLGLLIIDEEQRFGVSHKETLKRMRTEVDVLTLTATPIPRTLYMALTGVRDISTINTPPEERLPIITHVGPYSPRLVRQAILRELERGGQVFFVHNRVQTIKAMHAHLEKLVPEARLSVAHGQMNENELSGVMEKFTAGEVDVLLSTSIIESGLDIPNANTLIVDRADTFGLAQLYQLRGRVGRGAQRAYAYFFRHRRKPPTEDGRQRLETIAENTQLGAGYSIAMRDLEIRGAGDLLGMRQSGHIAAVGFHLYTRLLSGAVRRLRLAGDLVGRPELKAGAEPTNALVEAAGLEENVDITMPVSVDLPIPVGIPTEYVADKNMRLRLYRRIAGSRNPTDIDTLAAEFSDRFGPLPEFVNNLFYQTKVKVLADLAGLASVSSENGQIVLRYPPLPEGMNSRPIPLVAGSDVRTGKNSLWISSVTADWKSRLLDVLAELRPDF